MAGGQAVREPSSAQVVDVRVHDHRASQDVVRADQRDERVLEIEQGHARVVPVYVAQVSGVSRLVLRTAVFFLGGKIKKKIVIFFFSYTTASTTAFLPPCQRPDVTISNRRLLSQ